MNVTRLHPVAVPKPDVSDHDRIMAALNQAINDQQLDNKLGQSARGVAIIWLREDDNTFNESWIIQGMNALEAIGLMHITAEDIGTCGLTGGPDHFSGGRPTPEDEPA